MTLDQYKQNGHTNHDPLDWFDFQKYGNLVSSEKKRKKEKGEKEKKKRLHSAIKCYNSATICG